MDIVFWGDVSQQKIFTYSCDFVDVGAQSDVISPYMAAEQGLPLKGIHRLCDPTM